MKLVVTEFLSLDGVMENPSWTAPYWGDDIGQFKGDETNTSEALLLGRKTYEGFAQAWPQSNDPGADFFNNVRKYVATTTLRDLDWNNSQVIEGDVATAVAALKAQPGGDLTVHGSATLAQYLMEQGLVDELRLIVYPVTVGSGKRLFPEGLNTTFALTSVTPFASGAVGLVYRAQPAPAVAE